MSTAALVSVVLPVYNCPDYIGEAIKSILDQTFKYFEFIIIDDGSTDNTSEVIQTFNDPRIHFFRQQNQGLAATLNRGIEMAHGKYIARQDQDDISLPERLEKQVIYLDSHPECGMVGTWAEIWVEKEKTRQVHQHPSDNKTLQYELLFDNPFVHSSMMLRKSVLDKVGRYSIDRKRQPPEDYELWSRIARHFQVANIPEILQVYRDTPGSMSKNGVSPFMNNLVTLSSENIAWAAKLSPIDPNAVNIAALTHNAPHCLVDHPNFSDMNKVLNKVVEHISPNDIALQLRAKIKLKQLKTNYLHIKPTVWFSFYSKWLKPHLIKLRKIEKHLANKVHEIIRGALP
jgi:glycosyltransferase involved in cell wall biosynthesis